MASAPDFSATHALLQQWVSEQHLAGVSAAVQYDGELIDECCFGQARLALADSPGQALRSSHIHRAFSNTKLVTAVLTLMLVDDGQLALDAPVAEWLPSWAKLRVLRAGASRLDDTEALATPITLRHLLSHQAGLSHGVFDPGTLLYEAYHARGVRRPDTTLAQLMDTLAGLPLNFQPGQAWEYSLAPDVLARVIEVATGQRFSRVLQARLLEPLGMVDTGYVLSEAQRPRLADLYVGDLADPWRPGLAPLHDKPWRDAFLKPVPRESGAGGLFTTQTDMLGLLTQLQPGQRGLLQQATLGELLRDQLPPELCVNFPHTGALPDLGFSLGGAVTRCASERSPAAAVGEMQWGGLAGTHWWLHPATGVSGVLMTQRFMGFWHPFWFAYRRAVYQALDAGGTAPGSVKGRQPN